MDEKVIKMLELLTTEVISIKEDVKGIKEDVKNVKEDVKGIKDDVKNIKDDVKNIKSQQTEHGQILKALEHASEVNKAEHDNINFALAEIKGEVSNIRKDLSNVEVITASNWGEIAKLKSVK